MRGEKRERESRTLRRAKARGSAMRCWNLGSPEGMLALMQRERERCVCARACVCVRARVRVVGGSEAGRTAGRTRDFLPEMR